MVLVRVVRGFCSVLRSFAKHQPAFTSTCFYYIFYLGLQARPTTNIIPKHFYTCQQATSLCTNKLMHDVYTNMVFHQQTFTPANFLPTNAYTSTGLHQSYLHQGHVHRLNQACFHNLALACATQHLGHVGAGLPEALSKLISNAYIYIYNTCSII